MLKEILASLDRGRLDLITIDNAAEISKMAVAFLAKDPDKITKLELDNALDILKISNILYNNTNRAILPLEDGVYDLLVVKYDKMTGNKAPVGAPPVHFNELTQETMSNDTPDLTEIVRRVKHDGMMFYDSITNVNPTPIQEDFTIDSSDNKEIERRTNTVKHEYPELVGTLDKCKFTTIDEAIIAGAEPSDPNLNIFERDFLMKHAQMGINVAEMICELKYDGISIEAEIDGDTIISARTRGDTEFDNASDLTPIFGGYKFKRAEGIMPKGTIFGMKFEAIVTYENLIKLKEMFGKTYVNGRVAAIGLTGRKDARRFRDFITLVPLYTAGLNIPNRQVEIEFLNKYYTSGVNLVYQMIGGGYATILYQVQKFVSEAEYMRAFMPFMYDGVVVSYTDPGIKKYLGRQNFINKWSIAIKFNANKKQSVFRGFEFTVGADGRITPMAYFNAVEFFGTIHDKTTIHSLKRFKELSLRVGDIVDLQYMNDVIVYLTKPQNSFNAKNSNPVIPFIDKCPSCGGPITVSDSGDSAYCLNFHCPERIISRMSKFLKKVDFKDFSESTVKQLHIASLTQLYQLAYSDIPISILGEVNGAKFKQRIIELMNTPIDDYRIIGALGFSSLSVDKWKKILTNISLDAVMHSNDRELYSLICLVKGLGKEAAKTVVTERRYFMQDLELIASMKNIISSFGNIVEAKTVRFTGCRSKELEEAFRKIGFDADGNKSVTKKTDILIVPYSGYNSSKLAKIDPARCIILTEGEAPAYIANYNGDIANYFL